MATTFGAVLRNLLAERDHVSRAQVAANAGVALTTIYNLINDEPVRFSNTLAILRVLTPPLTDSEIEVAALALGKEPSYLESLLREGESPVEGGMVALAPARTPGADQPRDPAVRIDIPGQRTRALEELIGELIESLGVTNAEAMLSGMLQTMRTARRQAVLRSGLEAEPPSPAPGSTSPRASVPSASAPSPRSLTVVEQEQRRVGNTPYVDERRTTYAPHSAPHSGKDAARAAGKALGKKARKKG